MKLFRPNTHPRAADVMMKTKTAATAPIALAAALKEEERRIALVFMRVLMR